MVRFPRLVCLTAVLTLALAGGALGDDYAGPDPSVNLPIRELPLACTAPTSSGCVDAGVTYLNRARATLGQSPYRLPSDFDSLTPAQQVFVLSNLDRVTYGLRPIQGLTGALSQDSLVGIRNDTDPQPSASNFTVWTGNWAGGFPNIVWAYGAWMYDDGPGSGNLDCTTVDPSGCWGHRHDVLWRFDNYGPLAMGAAAAADRRGTSGFAMLVFEGDTTYHPSFTYTWAQALSAGAGGTASPAAAGSPAPVSVAARAGLKVLRVLVHGRSIAVRILAPSGSRVRYALSRRAGRGWTRARFRPWPAGARLLVPHAGTYRLQIRGGASTVTRYLRVR